ncbi:hypothetical protein AST03_07060, partial [Staphylococcus equorum]|uniref:YSIRK-type signal peptide-containing protein n=1 Tax=Staphylococcus equorum TaxID=246432 RepID=UPI000852A5BC
MRERQRFSIRKLGVGVGSVLIGLTIFATSGNVASADERQNKGDSFESVVSDKSVGEIGSPIQNDTEKPSEDEKGTIETAQQEIENVKAENTSEVSQEKSELSNESKEEVTQEEPVTPPEDEKDTEEVPEEDTKTSPEDEKDKEEVTQEDTKTSPEDEKEIIEPAEEGSKSEDEDIAETNATLQRRADVNNQATEGIQTYAALADVTLLDNMELTATHNNGVLNLQLEGRPLVGLGVGNTYPTFQLSPQFRDLMADSNFLNAIELDYDLPGLLGVLRNTGTLQGNELTIDPNTGVVYGTVENLVNLGVGSRVTYNLMIDLNQLTENGMLPESDLPGRQEYNFSSAAGSGLINVDLLANSGNDTSIVIENEEDSESISESESLSTSESLSESESLSDSESLSESESLSASES